MNGRITVLVENTARKATLLAEHGLALWIEIGKHKILFDTGQSPAVLLNNAGKLGIKLNEADAVVLSHGHYDHSGALALMLELAPEAKFFAHPAAFGEKYSRHVNGTFHDISIPLKKDFKQQVCSRFILNEDLTEVGGGLKLTGYIPRIFDFETTGGAFFKDDEGREADMLDDDQSAFIETPDGITVICGCAHAGLLNTLYHVRKLCGNRPIHTMIGGTHLITANAARITKTIVGLETFSLQRLAPLHCNGLNAACALRENFSTAFIECNVGSGIEI